MSNDESWAKFKKKKTRYFRQRNSNRKKISQFLKLWEEKDMEIEGTWR